MSKPTSISDLVRVKYLNTIANDEDALQSLFLILDIVDDLRSSSDPAANIAKVLSAFIDKATDLNPHKDLIIHVLTLQTRIRKLIEELEYLNVQVGYDNMVREYEQNGGRLP